MVSNKTKKDIKQNINRKLIIFFFFLILDLLILKEINKIIIKKAKISIIIPTYNRANIISKAIKSCLKQTYNSIEIFIIDDCSKDNTKEVIKKINDTRIKYIKLLKHKGASYSRNVGIKKAKGTYISFLDSDDVFLPEKLKLQLNNLINHNSDLDFCQVKRIVGEHQNIIPNKIQVNIIKNGNIPVKYDLYISTDTKRKMKLIKKYTNIYSKTNNVHIKIFENKGRDILPFLTQMREVIHKYKYLCHLHSKKTCYSPEIGNNWRIYLYNNLLGTIEIISQILSDFEFHNKLGFIFPQNY